VITVDIGFDPVIAQVGPFQLGWHGVFTALAVIAGVWIAQRLASRRGVSGDVVSTIATWAIAGGIIGARLFHVLDHLPQYAHAPLSVLAVWEGGIAVYGAFIGGLLAGGVAAWRARADLWMQLDVAAPAMLVGQAIGRLGCLCNGDAWGADATGCPLCLAVRYTHANDLLPADLRGVPTYAYPIYEIAAELVLLAVLWLSRDRLRQYPGVGFLLTMVGYGLIRFVLTYLRQEPAIVLGLQEAQVLALATGLVGASVLLWRLARRPWSTKVAATPIA
jgi:phosphatidylglycerol---prolipoprotein diacylglyceryl transferase